MSNHKIQDLLQDWLDIARRYEQGMIPEKIFTSIHITLAQQASTIKPTILEEANAQLLLFKLMWKTQTSNPTTPFNIAMDKMLGHVVEFFSNKAA